MKERINLLSPPGAGNDEKIKRRFVYKPSLFITLFAFILIGFEMAFLMTFYKNISRQILVTKNYQNELTDEIENLTKDINKLKTQEQIFKNTKILDLSKLETASTHIINTLELFSKTLPSEMWMSHVSQRENHFFIHGFALNHEMISRFLIELERSKRFSDVKLIRAEELLNIQRHLKKFTIDCQIEHL